MDTRKNRLTGAVLASTLNLSFEQKYEKKKKKKTTTEFVSENFKFLEVKFLMYLNRRVFVMKLQYLHIKPGHQLLLEPD